MGGPGTHSVNVPKRLEAREIADAPPLRDPRQWEWRGRVLGRRWGRRKQLLWRRSWRELSHSSRRRRVDVADPEQPHDPILVRRMRFGGAVPFRTDQKEEVCSSGVFKPCQTYVFLNLVKLIRSSAQEKSGAARLPVAAQKLCATVGELRG